MCGIAAIFAYHGSAPNVSREELLAIRDQMTARGPDGEGAWFSPDFRVGLGHRRLSIIDLSPAGAQPMFSTDGSFAIVFNGEIYNYRELRAQLENEGCKFQSQSDTEVLLHLYARRGEQMFDQVRGMYAFAIWDQKNNGLFLARDPFGIKPLYIADDNKTVRVASQLKALRAGGQIDQAPEPAGHVGYFLWGHVPDPYTMYRAVRSLPAGTSLWIGRDGTKRERTFCDIPRILQEGGEAELVGSADDQLHEALADTVRHHLIADVPVGVFLSSGLDSTSIAALAAEQGGELRTVTLGFHEYRGKPEDETELAEQFARHCAARHETIWVSRADFEAERDHLFEAMDRPSTDGVNTFFVSLAAKRAGLKVALSGLGGDEVFGSYPSFREIPRIVRLASVGRKLPVSGRAMRIVSAPFLMRFTSPKYAGLFEYGGSFGGAYLLRRGMFMPWELPNLLDPEIVRAGWEELQPLLRLNQTVAGLHNSRLKVSALEMCWYMRNQLLRDSDWAGMAHSLEIRVPMVDTTFLRALAPLLASPNPPGKRQMASAGASRIPTEILNRPKTGFSIPVREWLLTDLSYCRGPQRVPADRGLRGWAKHVYRHFPGSLLRQPPRTPTTSSAKSYVTSVSTPARIETPKRILIFRIGQLGDTLVSLPAMWRIKKSFPDAYVALLCDRHPGTTHIMASDLLRGSGLFDEFISYPVSASGELVRRSRMASLLGTLRKRRFDTLVYLAPTNRTEEQVVRDRKFFSLAGIENFIGTEGFYIFPTEEAGEPLSESPRESELLLQRLTVSGVPEIADRDFLKSLSLDEDGEAELKAWLQTMRPDGGRPWIAVGPGSKMPAKRWSLQNFREVVSALIDEFDVWPVVFGGEEERSIGDWLLARWGRGYTAAGSLGLRSSLAAIKRSIIFLGNDTGTMHMAAAVGVPCVAIFSSRDRPGLWYPHGKGHRVFRSTIECEGCGLVECLERGNECLRRISAREVREACRSLIAGRIETRNLVAV